MIKKLIEIFACSVLLLGSHFLGGMDATPAPTTSSALMKIKFHDKTEIPINRSFFEACHTFNNCSKDTNSQSSQIFEMSENTPDHVNPESLSALNLLYLAPNKEANLAHIKKQELGAVEKLHAAANYLNCENVFLNALKTASQNPVRKTPAKERTIANKTKDYQILDFSNCQLEALTGIGHHPSMANVTKINISNNYLRTINLGKLLAQSSQLQKLIASNCQTEKLKLDRPLPYGFQLDVSHNELTDRAVLPLLHFLNREGCLVNLTANRLSDDAKTKIKSALQPTFWQRNRKITLGGLHAGLTLTKALEGNGMALSNFPSVGIFAYAGLRWTLGNVFLKRIYRNERSKLIKRWAINSCIASLLGTKSLKKIENIWINNPPETLINLYPKLATELTNLTHEKDVLWNQFQIKC